MTNVTLPAGTWVDLYTATGITVGLQLTVQNITSRDVRLSATAIEPVVTDDHIPLTYGHGLAVNEAGDAGAWALALAGGAVDVKEV